MFGNIFNQFISDPLPLLNVDFGLGKYTVNGCLLSTLIGGRGGRKIEEFAFIVRRAVTRVNSSLVPQVILARIVDTCRIKIVSI